MAGVSLGEVDFHSIPAAGQASCLQLDQSNAFPSASAVSCGNAGGQGLAFAPLPEKKLKPRGAVGAVRACAREAGPGLSAVLSSSAGTDSLQIKKDPPQQQQQQQQQVQLQEQEQQRQQQQQLEGLRAPPLSVSVSGVKAAAASSTVATTAMIPQELRESHRHHARASGSGAPSQPSDTLPQRLDPLRLPRHVAIILDGNSRWAQRRGLPKELGHEAGVQALKRTVRHTGAWGIEALTVFAFSTENWRRPKAEVNFLMALLERLLRDDVDELHRDGVMVRCIGDLSSLSPSLQRRIEETRALTEHNTGLKLTIAFNYSGRQDIVHACQGLAGRVAAGELAVDDITEELVDASLATAWLGRELSSPDLLIRTSGEQRISNFLLWQAAYTELVFCKSLWPDFDAGQYAQCLEEFQQRDRRFGGRKEVHAAGSQEAS